MAFHEDGRLYPHDVENKARIYEDKHGNLWVTHDELLDCGYRAIETFDIVYLNGKFYELQGHIRKAQGWWIEEVTVEEAPETIQPDTQEVPQTEQA